MTAPNIGELENEMSTRRQYGYDGDCCEEKVDPITLLGKDYSGRSEVRKYAGSRNVVEHVDSINLT